MGSVLVPETRHIVAWSHLPGSADWPRSQGAGNHLQSG